MVLGDAGELSDRAATVPDRDTDLAAVEGPACEVLAPLEGPAHTGAPPR